jgi:hypothetical protein
MIEALGMPRRCRCRAAGAGVIAKGVVDGAMVPWEG